MLFIDFLLQKCKENRLNNSTQIFEEAKKKGVKVSYDTVNRAIQQQIDPLKGKARIAIIIAAGFDSENIAEESYNEQQQIDKKSEGLLNVGFSHSVLATPILDLIATDNHPQAQFCSLLNKENGSPLYFKATDTINDKSFDFFKGYRKSLPDNRANGEHHSYILSENDLRFKLLDKTFDCVFAPEGIVASNNANIWNMATISLGTQSICKPCIIAPKDVIDKLCKIKKELNRNFTYDKLHQLLEDTQGVNVIVVNNHLSRNIYLNTYFEDRLKTRYRQDKFHYCELSNVEELLLHIYSIAKEGKSYEGKPKSGLEFEKLIGKTKKILNEKKMAFLVLYSYPQIHWLQNIIRGFDDIGSIIYELSDLFPETVAPIISYNLYARKETGFISENKELFEDLYSALSTNIEIINETLDQSMKKLEDEDFNNLFPRIKKMATYLGMDSRIFAKAAANLKFKLYYGEDWIHFKNG